MSSDSVEIRSADGEWQEVRGIVTFNYVSDLSPLAGVPYEWPDMLDDGHPGGFFEKWLNVIGHDKGRRA